MSVSLATPPVWNERGCEWTEPDGKFWRWHPINGEGCNCGVPGCFYSNDGDRKRFTERQVVILRGDDRPRSHPWWRRIASRVVA